VEQPQNPLFRQQALQHHAGQHHEGQLLRLSPSWTRWTFWLLVALFVAAGLYGGLGRVHEYATGPAVVRVDGRVDLTAKLPGTVATVEVQPGQRVAVGQPLVQFYDDAENAELERVRKEFDLQLLKVLREPADQMARQAMSSLRAQRELASTQLAERLIRAPRAGVVNDVRIRPGQHLAPGELILTVVPDDAQLSLVAILPGGYRPQLHPGMPLRFELVGYRYEYHELAIDSIGDQVVGPNEATRFLGAEIADSVPLAGPVVLVRAHLPARSFASDGRSLDYYDGLPALAQARVRSEPIAVMLVPALRTLLRHVD
jgi:membrane fusion protein (multidrug efflux system)